MNNDKNQQGFIGILVALIAVLVIAGGTYVALHTGVGIGYKQPEEELVNGTNNTLVIPSSKPIATSTEASTTVSTMPTSTTTASTTAEFSTTTGPILNASSTVQSNEGTSTEN